MPVLKVNEYSIVASVFLNSAYESKTSSEIVI